MTKSNLNHELFTDGFLRRMPRWNLAFESKEPVHSFKNNINYITSLFAFFYSSLKALSLCIDRVIAYFLSIETKISFLGAFLQRRFFSLFFRFLFRLLTFSSDESFSFVTISE